ncbi:MAG TPA: hypothetical protein VFQ21_12950 [Gemmatimonadota bacterium]|nr:hypothetical protein [Gemmatimonadota bacterium]
MSALIGSLAFAVLFILFGALPRRGSGCLGCDGPGRDVPFCPGCPHAGERSAPTEGERE